MAAPLIIDLDGVLRIWDPNIITDAEKTSGLPTGALSAAAFGDDELLIRAITGAISDEEWRREIAGRLAAHFGDAAFAAVKLWSKSAGTVDSEVLAVIRDERRRREVAILSNATTRLDSDLSRLGLCEEVDHVINSSDLGVAKPDPLIFLRACELLHRAAEDCLFVDDTFANARAATSAGLRAHHYTNVDGLRSFLAAC